MLGIKPTFSRPVSSTNRKAVATPYLTPSPLAESIQACAAYITAGKKKKQDKKRNEKLQNRKIYVPLNEPFFRYFHNDSSN